MLFEQFLLERSKTRSQRHSQEEADKASSQAQCREEIQALLENSKNQKHFIAGAKKIWMKFRMTVREGRPSEWRKVITEIEGWYKGQNRDFIFGTATDGQLIKHVKSKHPTLHKDTIQKYVKLWRLTWTPPWNRSIADWRWLKKKQPDLFQDELEIIKSLHSNSKVQALQPLLSATEQRISAALRTQ